MDVIFLFMMDECHDFWSLIIWFPWIYFGQFLILIRSNLYTQILMGIGFMYFFIFFIFVSSVFPSYVMYIIKTVTKRRWRSWWLLTLGLLWTAGMAQLSGGTAVARGHGQRCNGLADWAACAQPWTAFGSEPEMGSSRPSARGGGHHLLLCGEDDLPWALAGPVNWACPIF